MPACCHSAFTYQSRRRVVTDPTPFLVSLQSPKGPKSAFRSRRDRSLRSSRVLKKLRIVIIIALSYLFVVDSTNTLENMFALPTTTV